MRGWAPRAALWRLLTSLLVLTGPGLASASPYIEAITYGGSCVKGGAAIDLKGKGFGKQGDFVVVARSLPGKPTLSTTAWTDTSIRALTASGPTGGFVTVALRDANGAWHGNEVKYPVCVKKPSGPPGDSKKAKAGPGETKKPAFSALAGHPSTRRQLNALRPTGRGHPLAGEELVVLSRRRSLSAEPELSTQQDHHILNHLDLVLEVRRPGPGVPAGAALHELRMQPGVVAADLNDRLELLAEEAATDPRRYATRLLGWEDQDGECGRRTRIGLVDTGVDKAHPSLRGAAIRDRSFTGSESGRDHGTAIAALLLGRGGPMPGLVPKAELWVAVAVGLESGGAARAQVAAIGRALDWLVGKKVRVINLSMGGSRNSVLHELVRRVLERDVVVVAAAGNSGRSTSPVHPAAQEGVLAVSAVDTRSKPWRGGNRGAYVDLAAPGVDLWVARAGGSHAFASGTSFAAPFVTAAVAALGESQDPERLLDDALDLGEPGHDPVFGHGLLRPPAACLARSSRAAHP